jgi:hypothetical protein
VRTDAADTLLAHCGPRKPDSTVPAGVAWQENVEQVAMGIAGGIAGVHAAHCFLKGFLSGEQAGQRIAFARVGFWRMGRHTGMVQVAAACTVWDMRVGAMAVLHTTPWGLQLAGTIILLNFHFNKRFQK